VFARVRSRAKSRQELFTAPSKIERWRNSVIAGRPRDFVIPAWSAGIQADMDVSGRILRAWMPAIHAGMTAEKPVEWIAVFMFCGRAQGHETLCGKTLLSSASAAALPH
jgi:hypothetical protein